MFMKIALYRMNNSQGVNNTIFINSNYVFIIFAIINNDYDVCELPI